MVNIHTDIKSRLPGYLVALFTLAVAFFAVFFPDRCSLSVRVGLDLFCKRLLPALFPMAVISGVFCKMGKIPGIPTKIIARLARISEKSAVAFVFGAVAGFPIGAMLVGRLYKNGEIDREEGERMLGLCSVASPAFLISAVGINMFGNIGVGILLYGVQLAVTVLLLFLTAGRVKCPRKTEETCKTALPTVGCLVDAVAQAAVSMLSVAAFVTFFSVVCNMLGALLPDGNNRLRAITGGFLEIGCGMNELSCFPEKTALPAAALFAGWSGLSVHMQVMSVSGELSLKRYFLQKVIIAAACSLLVFSFCAFFC